MAYRIPIYPGIPQSFTVTMATGLNVWMRVYWVEAPEAGWTLDLGRSSTEPLVCGIPLVPGQNLLSQYPELQIPVDLHITTPGDPDHVPTFAELGVTSHLEFTVAA